MSVKVTYENTSTGDTETVELPADDFMVICCRATHAVDEIAAYLASENGIMRMWKAEELASQAVDALIKASPTLLLGPKP